MFLVYLDLEGKYYDPMCLSHTRTINSSLPQTSLVYIFLFMLL